MEHEERVSLEMSHLKEIDNLKGKVVKITSLLE
jgi:hypothetical protein